MKKVYCIEFLESERGWSQERWTESFSTEKKRQKRIDNFNASKAKELEDYQRTKVVPDYYVQIERIWEQNVQ